MSVKKLLLFASVLLLAGVVFTSCKKDGGGDPSGNYFKIGTSIFNVQEASQTYFSDIYGSGTINIDLAFYNDDSDADVRIEMFVASGDRLVAGTYTFSDTKNALTFSDGGSAGIGGDRSSIVGGTVVIAVSGDTYTIDFDCTLEDGTKVSGHYSGILNWLDAT